MGYSILVDVQSSLANIAHRSYLAQVTHQRQDKAELTRLSGLIRHEIDILKVVASLACFSMYIACVLVAFHDKAYM